VSPPVFIPTVRPVSFCVFPQMNSTALISQSMQFLCVISQFTFAEFLARRLPREDLWVWYITSVNDLGLDIQKIVSILKYALT